MDKVTLLLILFILGIILVTVLPHVARLNPINNRNRDPEFQAEKKPPKVIPVIVPVYPKERPRSYQRKPRIIRILQSPRGVSYPPRRNPIPNIATMYRRSAAPPAAVNIPKSADVGLSQKNV